MNANPLLTALQSMWNTNVSTLVNNGKIDSNTANAVINQFNNYMQPMANAVHNQHGNRIPSSAITAIVQSTLTSLLSQQQQPVQQFPNTQSFPIQQNVMQQDMYNTNMSIGGVAPQDMSSIDSINRLGCSPVNEEKQAVHEQPEPVSSDLDLNNAIEIAPLMDALPVSRLTHVSLEAKLTRLPDEPTIDCEGLLPDITASHTMTGNMFTSNVEFGKVYLFNVEKETASESFSEHINVIGHMPSRLPSVANGGVFSTVAHVVHICAPHDASLLRSITATDNPNDIIDVLSSLTEPKLQEYVLYTANEQLKRFIRGDQFIGDIVALANIAELKEMFVKSQDLSDFQNTNCYQAHIKTVLANVVDSIKALSYDNVIFKVMPKIATNSYVSDHLEKKEIEKLFRYTFDGHIDDPFVTDTFNDRVGVTLMTRRYIVVDAVINAARLTTDKLFTVNETDALNKMFGTNMYSSATAVCLDGKEMFIVKNGVTLNGKRFYYIDNRL